MVLQKIMIDDKMIRNIETLYFQKGFGIRSIAIELGWYTEMLDGWKILWNGATEVLRKILKFKNIPKDAKTKEKIEDLFWKKGMSTTAIATEFEWYDCTNDGFIKPWKGITTQIRDILRFKDWDTYDDVWRNVKAKTRYKTLKKAGWRKARKQALERDNYKCVLTGDTENLQVHHIDGDISNCSLGNLITLKRTIHTAVTNGVNLFYLDPLGPDKRISYLEKYCEFLKNNGYNDACLVLYIDKRYYYWYKKLYVSEEFSDFAKSHVIMEIIYDNGVILIKYLETANYISKLNSLGHENLVNNIETSFKIDGDIFDALDYCSDYQIDEWFAKFLSKIRLTTKLKN